MKILIVSQTFPLTPTDSTAHFMYDFASGFKSLGHKVFILLPFNENLKPKSFKNINISQFKYVFPNRLAQLGYGRSLKGGQTLSLFNYLLIPFYVLFQTISLYKLVKNKKIDFINAHWILPNGPAAVIVSILTSKPLIITLPGSDVFVSQMNPLFWIVSKLSARFATIVTNSPQLSLDLKEKGYFIQYAVPVEKGTRILNKNVLIATAGRKVPKKGFEIIKKILPNIEVISGISNNEFRKKLLGIDIFIALSIRDSKGNLDDASLTVLEAMAAGCTVIASDLPGYRLIIENGKNGFLVNPKKINEIKSIIEKLRKSPALRRNIGKGAKKKIMDFYTPKSIAKEYVSLFLKAK